MTVNQVLGLTKKIATIKRKARIQMTMNHSAYSSACSTFRPSRNKISEAKNVTQPQKTGPGLVRMKPLMIGSPVYSVYRQASSLKTHWRRIEAVATHSNAAVN